MLYHMATQASNQHAPVRPAGTAPDWTVAQRWGAYRPADHRMWDRLFQRQMRLLKDRAAPEFLTGLERLSLSDGGIPHFGRLSERLMRATGWQVVAVPGLVPDEVFFDHLANRRFVAGTFIRRPDQRDYLQEPDVFHDVFGHVPLLALPEFADYMQAYGEGGRRAAGMGAVARLARLYWYSVEFGLVRHAGGLRLFGAGIVSSHAESLFALDDPSPGRIGFELSRVMRTPYRIDAFQQNYFVIDSFADLLDRTLNCDFGPLYAALENAPDIPIGAVLPSDRLFAPGTQAHRERPEP